MCTLTTTAVPAASAECRRGVVRRWRPSSKSWMSQSRTSISLLFLAGISSDPPRVLVGRTRPPFRGLGLNGIGFQQDGLEYGTRTHHSNADTYDRVQKADVMQSSMIEAWFAYNAATRAEMLPRIPTPAPDPDAKSHE